MAPTGFCSHAHAFIGWRKSLELYSFSPKTPHKPKEASFRGHCSFQLQQEALNEAKLDTTSLFPVELGLRAPETWIHKAKKISRSPSCPSLRDGDRGMERCHFIWFKEYCINRAQENRIKYKLKINGWGNSSLMPFRVTSILYNGIRLPYLDCKFNLGHKLWGTLQYTFIMLHSIVAVFLIYC